MKIIKYESRFQSFLESFNCGNMVINSYANSEIGTDLDGGITYLLVSDDEKTLIGFYSIEAGRLDRIDETGAITPMGGTININYLALQTSYQHTKLGESEGNSYYIGDFLLNDCEKRILAISADVGVSFITLYSSEDGYHMYHDRNGYEDFEDDMNTVVHDSDIGCKKLYKWVSDIA